MSKLINWYKNTDLVKRVILSMNLAIFVAILIISIFATINRINVQKGDARAMVNNELEQVTTLLRISQERDLSEVEDIIRNRVLYNTGFLSLIDQQGNVLVCRNRKGQNVSSTGFFRQMQNRVRGESVYTDPLTENTNYQYFTYFSPRDLYVVATLEKREFIDKPVYNTLRIMLFALIFTWIAFSVVNFFIMRTITTPTHRLINVLKQLGKGDLAEKVDYNHKDEVGQMAQSVNHLVEGLKRTAVFAHEIGKNNFDHPYQPLSEKDVLGNALLDMRQSLKSANEEEQLRKVEDQKRNWTTQGLARFAEILRQNNDNIEELSYDIIRNLVEYLEINQGGIFILNDAEDKQDIHLELTACYAFDRRKFLEKKIIPGEGLVGTCFLEKETIYLTHVPQDYIRITSGLGGENPGSLLLIPLRINEQVFGVIELAAFKPFEKYKLEFVEKIGESIASTISSVKINTQTAMLLQKSQQQAEEMRAQEEEMRQNMEELTATQEAMAEKERENIRTIDNLNQQSTQQVLELQAKENELMATLEECPDSVVKSDASGKIIFFNKKAEKRWGFNRNEVLGKDVKMLMPDHFSKHHDAYMQNYLSTGVKKIIGKGRDIEIKTKNGDILPAHLTIVETMAGKEVFFTGFFTDVKSENKQIHPHQVRAEVADMPGKEEEIPSRDKKSGQKPATRENPDITDLHKGDTSDTQKAWSEHLDQKGKQFRKGKKK